MISFIATQITFIVLEESLIELFEISTEIGSFFMYISDEKIWITEASQYLMQFQKKTIQCLTVLNVT